MLKLRFLTALLLIPVVLLVVYAVPDPLFYTFCALVYSYAAWEWAHMIEIKSIWARLGFVFLLWIAYFSMKVLHPINFFVFVVFAWLCALILIVLYPRATAFWKSMPRQIIIGLLVLGPAWVAINTLHDRVDPHLLMYGLLLVWGTDVAGFFVGRQWGETKLIPTVSPGKTVEGVLGGLLLSIVIGFMAMLFFAIPKHLWAPWLLTALATSLISIVGDLLVSLFKRQHAMKDTGSLLPGHGGLLDRIDSINAALPLFFLAVNYFGFTL